MGGASKGIGAATAVELAELCARVVLMARNEKALNDVAQTLPGTGHICFVADVSDTGALKEKLQKLLQEVERVDILVCNSGGPPAGPLAEATVEALLQGFTNHVLANQTLLQAFLPGMKAARFGRIINIISTSVKIPIPNLGVSNTIRGAVASWAKTLASELGPYGITVNNILPGFTATERLESLRKATSERLKLSENEVDIQWKTAIPAGRFAEARELGQAVAYLASPAAAYINGINLPVDGGRTGTL